MPAVELEAVPVASPRLFFMLALLDVMDPVGLSSVSTTIDCWT